MHRDVTVGGGGSSKTSCGCFYPLNLFKYTCTNTQCKLPPPLAVLCNTYTQLNPGMSVFSSRKSLASCITSTDGKFLSHIFPNWMASHQSLPLSLFLKTGTRLRAFVSREHSLSGFHGALILKGKHCCHSEL